MSEGYTRVELVVLLHKLEYAKSAALEVEKRVPVDKRGQKIITFWSEGSERKVRGLETLLKTMEGEDVEAWILSEIKRLCHADIVTTDWELRRKLQDDRFTYSVVGEMLDVDGMSLSKAQGDGITAGVMEKHNLTPDGKPVD